MEWFILIAVAIVIGASVLAGKMLSRPGRSQEPEDPEDRDRRHERMMALKASGALRHRKSNRP